VASSVDTNIDQIMENFSEKKCFEICLRKTNNICIAAKHKELQSIKDNNMCKKNYLRLFQTNNLTTMLHDTCILLVLPKNS